MVLHGFVWIPSERQIRKDPKGHQITALRVLLRPSKSPQPQPHVAPIRLHNERSRSALARPRAQRRLFSPLFWSVRKVGRRRGRRNRGWGVQIEDREPIRIPLNPRGLPPSVTARISARAGWCYRSTRGSPRQNRRDRTPGYMPRPRWGRKHLTRLLRKMPSTLLREEPKLKIETCLPTKFSMRNEQFPNFQS